MTKLHWLLHWFAMAAGLFLLLKPILAPHKFPGRAKWVHIVLGGFAVAWAVLHGCAIEPRIAQWLGRSLVHYLIFSCFTVGGIVIGLIMALAIQGTLFGRECPE